MRYLYGWNRYKKQSPNLEKKILRANIISVDSNLTVCRQDKAGIDEKTVHKVR